MGRPAYETVWQPLLRGKFGEAAPEISVRARSMTRARREFADISSDAVAVRKNAGASMAVRMA